MTIESLETGAKVGLSTFRLPPTGNWSTLDVSVVLSTAKNSQYHDCF